MMPTALITGSTGQDGSCLIDFLLTRGYRVIATVRNQAKISNISREQVGDAVIIEEMDLSSQLHITSILDKHKPDEIYNFAAKAYGSALFDEPVLTGDINGLAVARLLEAIRTVNTRIRFFQASSSEMFGRSELSPQSEQTPFNPQNPYAAAKLYGHMLTNIYRSKYGIFACSGIFFNHESPKRGFDFVTRKVTNAAAKIKLGLAEKVVLGDLESRRDWGYAGDFVRGAWLMLQQSEPDDFVFATGETHSVRELCEVAFSSVGLNYMNHVVQDVSLSRAKENSLRVGDAGKARRVLGWSPTVSFVALIQMMIESDLKILKSINKI